MRENGSLVLLRFGLSRTAVEAASAACAAEPSALAAAPLAAVAAVTDAAAAVSDDAAAVADDAAAVSDVAAAVADVHIPFCVQMRLPGDPDYLFDTTFGSSAAKWTEEERKLLRLD